MTVSERECRRSWIQRSCRQLPRPRVRPTFTRPEFLEGMSRQRRRRWPCRGRIRTSDAPSQGEGAPLSTTRCTLCADTSSWPSSSGNQRSALSAKTFCGNLLCFKYSVTVVDVLRRPCPLSCWSLQLQISKAKIPMPEHVPKPRHFYCFGL